MITVYDLCYAQNDGSIMSGPSVATLWNKPADTEIPLDCVVVERRVPEFVAEMICE